MARTLLKIAAALLLAVSAALALAATSDGAIHARGTVQAQAAVNRIGDRAGTVVLRGHVDVLRVGSRGRNARRLTIRAAPGSNVRRLELRGARRTRLIGLRMGPAAGRPATLRTRRSSGIRVVGLRMRGGRSSARVRVIDSSNVTIRDSEVSDCRTLCLGVRDSQGFRLVRSSLHDCYGCDLLFAQDVDDATLRGNRFDRALPGPCGTERHCNHQDLVQVVSGNRWLIVDNDFGVYLYGAAQLYVSGAAGPADAVTIRGNRFKLGDPTVPGVLAANGVIIGNPPGFRGLPTRVVVEGNAILSGAPRTFDYPDSPWYLMANSIVLSENYAGIPEGLRPLVRNNSYGSMTHPQYCAPLARGGAC